MPTYEYRCSDGHHFERFFRSISTAQGAVVCPTCGLPGERRMSAGAGLLFKGSGFYITDYGKDGKKDQRAAPAKADASNGAPAPAAPGAGGDGAAAKPAAESKPAVESKPAPALAPAPKSGGSAE